jgi:NAD(P)H-dependent FMN reductase
MLNIPIILGSTRRGRQSVKVARFVHQRMRAAGVDTELLDLAEYDFPIMEERLSKRDDPPPRLQEFAAKVQAADAICIVSPEYNNGYPGVLKNALDYLWPEYQRKPFGIATVSAGGFGGLYALGGLRQVVIGLGAFSIPASFPVSRVQESFNQDGSPADPSLQKRADRFIAELVWFAEAIQAKRASAK